MSDIIVTYHGDGWNHVTVPTKGSVTLYPDGLLNVHDAGGRTSDTKFNVKRVELFYQDRDFGPESEKPTP